MENTTKLALALSGGGFTGYLFEIGALTALDDLLGDSFSTNDFDLFVGVSAGAAASLLANGVKPEEILEANLSGEAPYYFERRDIFAPAMGEGLKTILRAGQQLMPLLKLYYRNRHEMSAIDLLDQAQDVLPGGIYTLEPFARYLESTFSVKALSNSFERLTKELYIPAIDLETGQTVTFGEDGRRGVPISRAVTASSAAPIYFCPVRIEGRDYIDAGVGRIAFFEFALQKGADFLVVVNPAVRITNDVKSAGKPVRSGRPARIRERGFLSIGERASSINLEARFSQALELFKKEHPSLEVFVISPDPHETFFAERNFLNFRDRVQLLRSAYRSAAKLIQEQFAHLEARFAPRGVSISSASFENRMKKRLDQLEKLGAGEENGARLVKSHLHHPATGAP